jgi:hypothetical protein
MMEESANKAFLGGKPHGLSHPASIMTRAHLCLYVLATRVSFRKTDSAMHFGALTMKRVHFALQAIAEGQEQLIFGIDLVGSSYETQAKALIALWLEMQPQLSKLASGNGASSVPRSLIGNFIF